METNQKITMDYLLGKVDENAAYYTEREFQNDKADFLLIVLMAEGILKEEDVKEYKDAYIKQKNKQIVEELKKNKLEREKKTKKDDQ